MSACRGCGRPIVWGRTPEGTTIPLDPRAPVYRLGPPGRDGTAVVIRDPHAMVSHFVTCPEARP